LNIAAPQMLLLRSSPSLEGLCCRVAAQCPAEWDPVVTILTGPGAPVLCDLADLDEGAGRRVAILTDP
jgi:hypothetical protein